MAAIRWPFARKREAILNETGHVVLDPLSMEGRVFDLRQKQLARLDGFDLFVMPDDYVGASILSARTYEAHVERMVRSELRDDDVFLDLGANVGYFTLLASSVAKRGKVISFEPNYQNQQLIYASILANDAKNVEVYPYAVSDTAGLLNFATVGSNGGVTTEHSPNPRYDLIVQAVVLDDVLKDEPRLDLVKIDIEAHEPFAVRGMTKLIEKHRPKILTEFHPWAMRINNLGEPTDYLEQLFGLGYTLSIVPFTGETFAVSSARDITTYWESLGNETIQLDLFAQPKT